MRIKDMKPDTEYATCSGELVVTGSEVTGNWYAYKEWDDKTRRWSDTKIEQGNPRETTDPWGKCHVSPSKARISVQSGPGIVVTQYGYDRDGKRTEKGHTRVEKPRNIPGTWKEYLSLHAEDIRLRFEQRDVRDKADEHAKKVLEAMRAEFPGLFDGVTDSRESGLRVGPLVRTVATEGGRITGYQPALWLDLRDDAAEAVVERLFPGLLNDEPQD